MDRPAYNKCMIPWMKGGGEDRKLRFCTGAKVCSGKTKSEDEARQICLTQPAKAQKARKGRATKIDYPALASCVAATINIENLTAANLQVQLEQAIAQCNTGKSTSTRPLTYKPFMKSCLKKELGGADTDFLHSQKEIRSCQTKWNVLRGE